MHGLGNDVVIINEKLPSLEKKIIQQLANRHIGIGFDQLLLLEPSNKADFSCRIFNADGSEAEQCGNGMRCVARFVHESKLTAKKNLLLETKAGIISVDIHNYDNIRVTMGTPKLQQKNLILTPAIDNSFSQEISVLSMGNPHAILQVKSIHNFPVSKIGAAIENHVFFPQGVNVGFMEIVNPEHIRLRTFERGVGETLACGSNACAAVVAGIWNNLLDKKVKVELTLGFLWIEWPGEKEPVIMTGSANRVFDGAFPVS